MSASDDMRVVVDQMPADPVKPPPSKLPSWLQSKRNKALAGLSLLTLIAIPAIVAPVVVSQQKQQQHNTVSPRDQQMADEQMARNTATQNEDPDAFIDVEAPRVRNTTRFNATRYNSTRGTRRNTTSTLKVPARSWALANKTRASLTKPETWTPFVKIRDGQVRAQDVPGRLVAGGRDSQLRHCSVPPAAEPVRITYKKLSSLLHAVYGMHAERWLFAAHIAD